MCVLGALCALCASFFFKGDDSARLFPTEVVWCMKAPNIRRRNHTLFEIGSTDHFLARRRGYVIIPIECIDVFLISRVRTSGIAVRKVARTF